MRPISLALSFAMATFASFSTAHAQKYVPAPTVASVREADFVEDLIEDNDRALSILQLGIEKGTDAELKANAQKMLSEHQVMGSTFDSYLARRNVAVNGKIDTREKKTIPNKTGRDWDGKWADELADKHKKMLTRLEQAQGYVEDEELRTIINNAIPTLREYYQMSESMKMRLKGKK